MLRKKKRKNNIQYVEKLNKILTQKEKMKKTKTAG